MLVINIMINEESEDSIAQEYLLVTTEYWLYLISCLYRNTFAQIYTMEEVDLISPIPFPGSQGRKMLKKKKGTL